MKAVILGAGGGGRLYLDVLRDCTGAGNVEVIGFIDDSLDLQGRQVLGISVLGLYYQLAELIRKHKIEGMLVAYSDRFMKLREDRFNQCLQFGLRPISAIHPSAIIAPSVTVGEGVFIGRGVVVDLAAKIGNNCSIHRGATIGEYCVLGENIWLGGGANLAGNVTVDKNALIGTGANVIPRRHIGRDAIVGAGAAVVTDVPEFVTVVGVPARIMKARGTVIESKPIMGDETALL